MDRTWARTYPGSDAEETAVLVWGGARRCSEHGWPDNATLGYGRAVHVHGEREGGRDSQEATARFFAALTVCHVHARQSSPTGHS